MAKTLRNAKRRIRYPKYPYRGPTLWSHERAGEFGELVTDAISGARFPSCYAFDGPFGTVDCRDGGTMDLDIQEHECPITMKGALAPPRGY